MGLKINCITWKSPKAAKEGFEKTCRMSVVTAPIRLTPGIRAKGSVRSMTIWVPIVVWFEREIRSVTAEVDDLNPCIFWPSDVKFTVINKSGLKRGLGLGSVAVIRVVLVHT